jgi:hypothetical protein
VIFAQKMPVCLARVFLAADGFHDVFAIEDPDQSVNFRDVCKELGLVPLDEASRDDDALALPSGFHVHGIPDRFQRLGFATFQEPARVNHDGICGRGVIRNREPILGKETEHPLAVHEVFRAAKADECDGSNGLFCPGWHQGVLQLAKVEELNPSSHQSKTDANSSRGQKPAAGSFKTCASFAQNTYAAAPQIMAQAV